MSTNDRRTDTAADLVPSSFMESLLQRMPLGLFPATLLSVMTEQGITQEEAASVIRRSLERGAIRLTDEMRVEYQG